MAIRGSARTGTSNRADRALYFDWLLGADVTPIEGLTLSVAYVRYGYLVGPMRRFCCRTSRRWQASSNLGMRLWYFRSLPHSEDRGARRMCRCAPCLRALSRAKKLTVVTTRTFLYGLSAMPQPPTSPSRASIVK